MAVRLILPALCDNVTDEQNTQENWRAYRVFARLIKSTVVLQAKDHIILTLYCKRYVDRFNASVTARYMDRNEMKDVLYIY